MGGCSACGRRALAWYALGDDGDPVPRSLCCSADITAVTTEDEGALVALGLAVFEPPSPGGCGGGGCRSGGCSTRKKRSDDEKRKLQVVD